MKKEINLSFSLRFNEINSSQFFLCGGHNYDSKSYKEILSVEEFQKSQDFKFEARKNSFVSGRYFAKKALAQSISFDVRSISIKNGVFGQPYVVSDIGVSHKVSLAHSKNYAVGIAYPCEYKVAIDIEEYSDKVLNFSKETFSESEKIILQKEIKDDVISLTVLWVVKESLSKVIECGLTVPFAHFEIKKLYKIFKHNISYYVFYYKDYPQYKSIVYIGNDVACAVVVPRLAEFV